MFKKILAKLSIVALVLSTVPVQLSLADAQESLITSMTLTSTGNDLSKFNPSAGQSLSLAVTMNSGEFADEIAASSNGTLEIKQGNTLIHTLSAVFENGQFSGATTWNGRTSSEGLCGNDSEIPCPDGDYTFSFSVNVTNPDDETDAFTDTDEVAFTINNTAKPLTIDVSAVTVSGSTNFDPAPKAGNDDLTISYTLSGPIGSAQVVENFQIIDPDGRVVQNFPTDDLSETATFTWDGRNEGTNKLVPPGSYKASLKVEGGIKSYLGEKSFNVTYNDSNAPTITNFTVDPATFDPLTGSTNISFNNESEVLYSVEIWDATTKATQVVVENDQTFIDNPVEVDWDGTTSSGSFLGDGGYIVALIARNDYGVDIAQSPVSLVDLSDTIVSSNAHVDDIKCSPSSTFEPAEDDELECQFDAKIDLEDVVIHAVKGSEAIEIDDLGSVDEENNIEFTWDGTVDGDEDDYADQGSWIIRITSKAEDSNVTLTAGKKLTIKYDKPKIDEFEVSKDDIDPTQGDITYAFFKLDMDAEIDLEILESGDVDETVEEDFEVEKDTWYAIEVDLSDYDEDDDIDIQLIAKNKANDDIQNDDKVGIKLDEVKDSSSKSEVFGDVMSPVLSNGNGDFELTFELTDDADVEVSIHKGKSSSGTKQIELMDVDDVDAGTISLCWDGKNSSGKSLSDGYYTYKIVTKDSSSYTVTGTFRIDDEIGEVVGGADGGCGGSNDDDDDDNGGNNCKGGAVASGVVIEGSSLGCDDDSGSGSNSGSGSSAELCAGFTDVAKSSSYCNAIQWAESEGIFQGYADGSFRPFQAINRAEVLKVVLEAQNVTIMPDDFSSQGFIDVITGSWYMQYIRTAKQLGIFSGDAGKGTARPDATVNRAELLKFVFETLEVSRGFNVGTCSAPYSDVSPGVWYYNYACQSDSYGLFGGGNFLSPGSLSTRGEVAQVLYDLNQAGLF